jgi:predicted DNA-binding transcriptional regulator AlpA
MSGITREKQRAAAAAHYIGVSRSTLAKWRKKGCGPPFHRSGPRIVFYYKDEIDRWQAECDERERRKRCSEVGS